MGYIKLIIQEGRDLLARDKKMGMYCVLSVVGSDGKRRKLEKTPSKKGSLCPVWSTAIEGEVPDDIFIKSIRVDVYAHDFLSSKDFLGRATLKLGKDFFPAKYKDAWYKLQPRAGKNDTVHGAVRVSLEYTIENMGSEAVRSKSGRPQSVIVKDIGKEMNRMVKGRLKSCIFDGGKIRQELADDTLNTEQIQVQNVMIQTQSVVPLTFQPREGGSRSDLGRSKRKAIPVLPEDVLSGRIYLLCTERSGGLKWLSRVYRDDELLCTSEKAIRDLSAPYYHWVDLPEEEVRTGVAPLRKNWTLVSGNGECLFSYSIYYRIVVESDLPKELRAIVEDRSFVFGKSVVAGPVLLMRGGDSKDRWYTSALVMTKQTRSAETPQLTIQSEGVQLADPMVVQVHKVEDIRTDARATAVMTLNIWRMDWVVKRTKKQQVVECVLKCGNSTSVSEYFVPPAGEAPKVCSIAVAQDPAVDFVSQQLILRHHAEIDHFNIAIQTSAHINARDVINGFPQLSGWIETLATDTPHNVLLDHAQTRALRDAFVCAYCIRMAIPPTSHLLARIPSLMMWTADDIVCQDVMRSETARQCATYPAIVNAAREAFELLQLGLKPGTNPQSSLGSAISLVHPPSGLSYHVDFKDTMITVVDMWTDYTKHTKALISEAHIAPLVKMAKASRKQKKLRTWVIFAPACTTNGALVQQIIDAIEARKQPPRSSNHWDNMGTMMIMALLEKLHTSRPHPLTVVLLSAARDGLARMESFCFVTVDPSGHLAVHDCPQNSAVAIRSKSGISLPSPALFAGDGNFTAYFSNPLLDGQTSEDADAQPVAVKEKKKGPCKKKMVAASGNWKIAARPTVALVTRKESDPRSPNEEDDAMVSHTASEDASGDVAEPSSFPSDETGDRGAAPSATSFAEEEEELARLIAEEEELMREVEALQKQLGGGNDDEDDEEEEEDDDDDDDESETTTILDTVSVMKIRELEDDGRRDSVSAFDLSALGGIEGDDVCAPAASDKVVYVCDGDDIWLEPCDGEWNIELQSPTALEKLHHPHLLRGATLNKLIERLSIPPLKSNAHVDEYQTYMRTFFMTYRAFASPEIVFEKLVQRFHGPKYASGAFSSIAYPPLYQIQIAVCRCLGHWIEFHHHRDISANTALARSLVELTQQLDKHMNLEDPRLTRYDMAAVRNLRALVDSKMTKGTYVDMFSAGGSITSAPEPIMPSDPACPTLLDIPSLEFARQLTIWNHHCYAEIQPVELQDLAWSSKKLKHRAGNVLALIQQFNDLSAWCSSSIVSCKDLKERKNLMLHWLEVLQHCRELNNFNACMAIVSAFGNSAVYRLKLSFEQIQRSPLYEILPRMHDELRANQAYKTYRSILAELDSPCMPFIGVYLTDLTFVADGNQDKIGPHKLLNYRKRELEYDVIVQVLKFQSRSYNLKLVPKIMQRIRNIPILTENEMFKESLVCEPRKPRSGSKVVLSASK